VVAEFGGSAGLIGAALACARGEAGKKGVLGCKLQNAKRGYSLQVRGNKKSNRLAGKSIERVYPDDPGIGIVYSRKRF
jgi:hypothetical protein